MIFLGFGLAQELQSARAGGKPVMAATCRHCKEDVRSDDLDCPQCGAPTRTMECLMLSRQRGKLRPVILFDDRVLRDEGRSDS